MEITVLGSGAANRMPYISCHCARCEAARRDPHERRTTSGLWLRSSNASVLLDAGPDLYAQATREGIDRLDAIYITHGHRDHMAGLECLETLVRYGRGLVALPIYGPADLVTQIERQFDYLLRMGVYTLQPLPAGQPVHTGDLTVTAFEVRHHQLTTYGYRVEWQSPAQDSPGANGGPRHSLIYLPDVQTLPDGRPLSETEIPPLLREPDLFFIDGAFDDTTSGPRPGHVTWQQGAQFAARCGARRTVLTHISHHVDVAHLRQLTNENLVEARDGLKFVL